MLSNAPRSQTINTLSTGMDAAPSDKASSWGFFGQISGTMKNLTVSGSIEGTANQVGGAVAGLRVGAALENVTSNVTPATALTAEAVKEAIDKAIVALRERNFDEDGVIEMTPAFYNLFKNHLITLSTNNPELIKKGVVGMYDNFECIMSNNLKTPCDIRGKKAIAFAGQINKVEALRAEKRFKDIVRGLDTFGAKVIDENRIQVLTTA